MDLQGGNRGSFFEAGGSEIEGRFSRIGDVDLMQAGGSEIEGRGSFLDLSRKLMQRHLKSGSRMRCGGQSLCRHGKAVGGVWVGQSRRGGWVVGKADPPEAS